MDVKFITEYDEFGGSEGSCVGKYLKLEDIDKNKILKYLKDSKVIATRCSLVKDYIGKFQTKLGIKVHTDGEYEWADDEIYHFEKYDIKLNEDFVMKVLESSK